VFAFLKLVNKIYATEPRYYQDNTALYFQIQDRNFVLLLHPPVCPTEDQNEKRTTQAHK